MTRKKRVLTGINTTGTLHIGNYVGAIRPAIQDSRNPDVESFFFLADLHALIKCQDPTRIERSRMQIAATWLAAGLDPDHVTFYRQSDIPEIPLLCWMFDCVMSKGLLNRAHAYKAAVDAATAAGRDPDADVSMGLFSYPVLNIWKWLVMLPAASTTSTVRPTNPFSSCRRPPAAPPLRSCQGSTDER